MNAQCVFALKTMAFIEKMEKSLNILPLNSLNCSRKIKMLIQPP